MHRKVRAHAVEITRGQPNLSQGPGFGPRGQIRLSMVLRPGVVESLERKL